MKCYIFLIFLVEKTKNHYRIQPDDAKLTTGNASSSRKTVSCDQIRLVKSRANSAITFLDLSTVFVLCLVQ